MTLLFDVRVDRTELLYRKDGCRDGRQKSQQCLKKKDLRKSVVKSSKVLPSPPFAYMNQTVELFLRTHVKIIVFS